MEPDKAKPGTTTPEQVPSITSGPEIKQATPAGLAHAEQTRLKGQIETDRASKIERQKILKSKCVKDRARESWAGPQSDKVAKDKPDKGLLEQGQEASVKAIISPLVDKKFADYQAQFEANGLGDDSSINTLKQAAIDTIYDHYIKTGESQAKTRDYVTNDLGKKLKFLFDALQGIYSSRKYSFEKPADCLEAFSEFTGLQFYKKGSLRIEALKNALLLTRSFYELALPDFIQYLELGLILNNLKRQEEEMGENKPEEKTADSSKGAAPEGPSQAPGAPEPAPPPSATSPSAPEPVPIPKGMTLPLKDKARILITADTIETEAAIRKAVYEQLPDDADPKARNKTANWLVKQSKKLEAPAGETIEISPDGTWQKVDIAKEEAEKLKQQPEAPPTSAPEDQSGTNGPETQKPPTPEKSEAEMTGFERFFDKISKFFEKIMGYMNAILAKMGLTEAEEFAKLTDNEKKEALELKAAAEKTGLNLETLHPLFIDSEQTKKVLLEKKDQDIPWEQYLGKYLTAGENDELKKKQDLKAEKLAEMFITPVETPSTNPPAPAA